MKAKCIFCDKEAEFSNPKDLCGEHWQAWFDYELTIYCACMCGEPDCPGCACMCGECE